MNKQEHIANIIAQDPDKYYNMRVCDVKDIVGKKLQVVFDKREWTNDDSVVYGTLLTMLRFMHTSKKDNK